MQTVNRTGLIVSLLTTLLLSIQSVMAAPGQERESVTQAAVEVSSPRERASESHYEQRALTVRDAIDTAWIATSRMGTGYDWTTGDDRYSGRDPQFVSPNGSRFAAIVFRGDLARDGLWAEIVAGRLDSLASAAQHRTVMRFFTRAWGEGSHVFHREAVEKLFYRLDESFPFKWINERNIALLWEDDKEVWQATMIDVEAGTREHLTQHPTNVHRFDVAPDGTTFYVAEASTQLMRRQSEQMWREGFVASSPGFDLLLGSNDLRAVPFNRRWEGFVRRRGSSAVQISGDFSGTQVIEFAPQGRYVIADRQPPSLPEEWERYSHPAIKRALAYFRDGDPGLKLKAASLVRQLVVIDTDKGSVRPLWDAPTHGASPIVRWSPDGRSVLVGPTLLPPRSDDGDVDQLSVVVVDARSGHYQVLVSKVPVQGVEDLAASRWLSSNMLELRGHSRSSTLFARNTKGAWAQSPSSAPQTNSAMAVSRVRVELRQSLNMPPQLYAIDEASGAESSVLDPNPGLLDRYRLARVEPVKGISSEGSPWIGRLYYPVGHVRGRRYPLVIQTRAPVAGNSFSLHGPPSPGLGPGYSVYAAQALAGRGIAVLQFQRVRIPSFRDVEGTIREPQLEVATWEAAIEQLAAAGLVDSSRVALQGFSRSGWHVEYALTQSEFRYAAAIVSDNIDSSFLQHVLARGSGKHGKLAELIYERPPVEKGLEDWLENAPGFNVQRIQAPLRLYAESAPTVSILSHWEIFAQMSFLGLPVELYVVPEVSRGTHGVRNPTQVLRTKEGAVDWFDFWLNDHEDSSADKKDQYARWRKLRELHEATLSRPRPPLLDWTAAARAPSEKMQSFAR